MIVTIGANHRDIGHDLRVDRHLISRRRAMIVARSLPITVTFVGILVTIVPIVAMIGGDHREDARDHRYVGR
jgi:hypothetical protein